VSAPPATVASADDLARDLYHALAAAGHAPWCRAALSAGYDEDTGHWAPPACTCGRDAALARYEAVRQG